MNIQHAISIQNSQIKIRFQRLVSYTHIIESKLWVENDSLRRATWPYAARWFYKRWFERLSYGSYSLSACRCCSCWSAVSTLVPPWSTLAFIGDATVCPLGNSSVPMKLSAGRKSTERKEDNAGRGRRFSSSAFVFASVFSSFSFFFDNVSSRFQVCSTPDRNAFF